MAILSPIPGQTRNPIVLGIDPGTRITGFGVVSQVGSTLVHIFSGSIHARSEDSLELRLKCIYEQLLDVIRNTSPTHMAIESVFFSKNIRSAIILSHARGVALLAAAQLKLPVVEYSPMEVKKSVVGGGHASKSQVQTMVRHLLPQRGAHHGDTHDTTDALAVALCHLHISMSQARIELSISAASKKAESM